VLYGATSARLSVVNNIIDHAKALEGTCSLAGYAFGFIVAFGDAVRTKGMLCLTHV